ncbi:hypothetical protein P152DRAFT_449901 [Eremomyces bilateralis CBS 781.70]|uniref:C2H2-type domain-containing protein n=1 Tax=Eremomyces bilateralis CBS 781.70 TaxID=1392243 RepID=A0A6G1G241_9PEZI|nr:uncharacterized protein P152DRAFT_449901 [Eremomyces bilateralis CBS 781.70]KAF1812124.1 hypothetical protein P152DRAFT_449901 [Eremomyces bilateralis CBS 781.70]
MASTTSQESRPASHPFTCNTCQVAFRTSEAQRGHMQSDWHRYNLKRRIASLPPLSSEIFAEKVLANKASQAAVAAKAAFTRDCAACQKTYYSDNAYKNHLASQKHRQNEFRMRPGSVGDSMMSSEFSIPDNTDSASVQTTSTVREDQVDPAAEDEFTEVVDTLKGTNLGEKSGDALPRRPSRPHHSAGPEEDRPEHPISPATVLHTKSNILGSSPAKADPLLNCLFCNLYSPTVDLNILHMQKYHGMFIPEKDYLVDLPGLILYLREKINVANECLYCGTLKRTAEACQTHMLDKGHCMIAFGTEDEQLEISDFYDFTTTYSDDEDEDTGEEDEAASHASWETSSTLSSVPTEEITSVAIDQTHRYSTLDQHHHHTHDDPRPHRNLDGFHSRAHAGHVPKAVFFDDVEMHLGNGKSVGHRSWQRVWRQRLGGRNRPAESAQGALADAEGDVSMGDEGEAADDSRDSGALTRRERREELFHRGRMGHPSDALTRANDGPGMTGVTGQKKREVVEEEKRSRRTEQKERSKYLAIKERKGNMQKHFRDPLLQ